MPNSLRRLAWLLPLSALAAWVAFRLFSDGHVLLDVLLAEARFFWRRHAGALLAPLALLLACGLAAALLWLLAKWRRRRLPALPLQATPLRIFPSRPGWLFGTVLIVMQVTAINFNLALGQMLVFLLAGLMLVSMFPAWRNQRGIAVEARSDSPPGFAGGNVHFLLRLKNPGNFRRPGLVLFLLQNGAKGEPAALANLSAHGEALASLSVFAVKRGWLFLPPILVESFYPLGFFRVWQRLAPVARCLVYPRPVFLPFPPQENAGANDSDTRSPAGAEDFAGFRRRTPADSMRHVAWKKAAQDESRPLLVAHMEGGQAGGRHFSWEQAATLSRDPEMRFSILAGWVLEACDAGIPWSLSLPGVNIPAASGPEQQKRCLEALALAP
jgi:uncharacterized protein (DUF58 family)